MWRGSRSTTGGGGGDDDSVPTRYPKQPLPGIGLHGPLHGWQACSKFNSFHQGVGSNMSSGEDIFVPSLPKRGQICDIPLNR